jgi:DNA-binding transcriptional LysR family regulator
MNIVQLNYFLCVAERLSISAGARAVHVTQPAVTKQIRLLEEELGCPLFVRNKNRLALTGEGEQLRGYAREILSKIGEVYDAFNTRDKRVCGRLLVGCSVSSARQLLPDLLTQMLADYPDVHVVVEEMDWREARRRLSERAIDVAIGLEMTGDTALVFRPLVEGRLVFVHARSMRLKTKAKCLSGKALADMPFVAYPEDNILWQRFMSAYLLPDLNIVVRSRFTETIMTYVQAGMGVAVVPGYLMSWSPSAWQQVTSRELDKTIPVRFGYNTVRDRVFSPALRVFLDRLTESLSG